MAEGHLHPALIQFDHLIDLDKVFPGINAFQPAVMIPYYQMFPPFQLFQHTLGVLFALMEDVSEDVHVIPVSDSAVPVLDKSLVHFRHGIERPIAESDDAFMSQVQIRCKVCHVRYVPYWI